MFLLQLFLDVFLDAGSQLQRIEWLENIVCGSGFKQMNALGGAFFTGEHHYRNVLQ